MSPKKLFASGLFTAPGLPVAPAKPGDVFVESSGGVLRITPDGANRFFARPFGAPKELAFDSAGNLLVADFFNKVFKISPDGLHTTVLATVSGLSCFIAVEPGGTNSPAPVTILSPHLSGAIFTFSFTTVSNQSYTIQQNANLATTNWNFYTNLTGSGSVFQFSEPLPGYAQRFFRVVEP